MANRFLELYSEELNALRSRAGRFAEAFPKIASRLRLSPETADDPHVERLIQSFAYSTARLRQKLEDNLPELSSGLLETLYPNFLAPVPSMSIIAVDPADDLDGSRVIPRGTNIESAPIDGDTCRFVTTQDLTIAPIRIAEVKVMNRPIEAPKPPGDSPAGCLRVTIAPLAGESLSSLDLQSLRFHVTGPAREAQLLHSHISRHTSAVAIAAHSADPDARFSSAKSVRPVGFDDDEALLPTASGAFPGYRLLSEFFTLPEKFLFFDVEIGPVTQTDRLDLYLYFDAAPDQLEKIAGLQHLTLFATPVVNLFPARSEPVLLDGTRTSYPLMADTRRSQSRQVHSVLDVVLVEDSGAMMQARPFFHRMIDKAMQGVFYQIERHADGTSPRDNLTSLAFVDQRGTAIVPSGVSASVDILSTNGALPRSLPFGGGQPRLKMDSPMEGVAAVRCLQPITDPKLAIDPDDTAWQLLSQLSLNHLSLTEDGLPALKGILHLYDRRFSRETAQMINAISDIQTAAALTRMDAVMVSGIDITLTFDPSQIEPGLAVLFGSVIDRFLGGYTTLNTFTRLSLKLADRTDLLTTFPARAGRKPLL